MDCDRTTVSQRYERIARFIPFFDRLLFQLRNLRAKAKTTEHLAVSRSDCAREINCGTGNSFAFLQDAVGPSGQIYGVDNSSAMFGKTRERCGTNHWRHIRVSLVAGFTP